MAARAQNLSDDDFLEAMSAELVAGFILRSVRPDLIRSLLPFSRWSRTHVIAKTFERIFFDKIRQLEQLPARPELCINTTVLNHGQVGKFSRRGFSAWSLNCRDSKPRHLVPLPHFPISQAVAASAAFPIGLPPLELPVSLLRDTKLEGPLAGHSRLALTDGGVLENLGVQTLLADRGRFRAWNIVVSDAGTHEPPWNPSALQNPVRGFFTWLLSGRTLDRLMLVMNNKQNRWARQRIMSKHMESRLNAKLHMKTTDNPGLRQSTELGVERPARKLLFARVAQNWSSFILAIPRWRLVELAARCARNVPEHSDRRISTEANVTAIEEFLSAGGLDLGPARQHYELLGGDAGAAKMNRVATGFTALKPQVVEQLAHHASWQIHLGHAVYLS